MKIKKNIKNKAILFTWNFLCFFAVITLWNKFFGFRGPPDTWEDIVDALPIYIICSLGFAAWMTWVAFGDR
jgi:hypothetical protein